MRLEHYPLEKLKSEILTIAAKYLDLKQYKIFFFGSRVTDRGSDRSDIDVGILGPAPISLASLEKMKKEIEYLKTLYSIDLVDFSSVTNDFKTIALQKIEYLTPSS